MMEEGEDLWLGFKRELLRKQDMLLISGNLLVHCGAIPPEAVEPITCSMPVVLNQIQEPDSGDLEDLELLLWTRAEVEKAIDQGQVKSWGVNDDALVGFTMPEVNTEVSDVFILCGGQGTRLWAVLEKIFQRHLLRSMEFPFWTCYSMILSNKDVSGSSWVRVI